MRAFRYHLPAAVVTAMSLVALWHGPIVQPADYHDFADRMLRLGIPPGPEHQISRSCKAVAK